MLNIFVHTFRLHTKSHVYINVAVYKINKSTEAENNTFTKYDDVTMTATGQWSVSSIIRAALY
jgi:hypothetical protein